MTAEDKLKARADITKQRDDGVRKIHRASLTQLGEMTKLVSTARASIDKDLIGLGAATVAASHEIGALETDFARRIDHVKQYLESKTNTAIVDQAKIANATKRGLKTLSTRNYDSGAAWGDITRDLMVERADFYQQTQDEKKLDERRQAELDHLKTLTDPEGRRNLKPDQKPWNEETRGTKAMELMKAVEGGFGQNNSR